MYDPGTTLLWRPSYAWILFFGIDKLNTTSMRACTVFSARQPCSAMLRVDLVCGIPCTRVSLIFVWSFVQGESEKKKSIAAIMGGKQRKTFWKCYITCLLVKSSMEKITVTVHCVWFRRFIYTSLSSHYVLYHVACDGTIVLRRYSLYTTWVHFA